MSSRVQPALLLAASLSAACSLLGRVAGLVSPTVTSAAPETQEPTKHQPIQALYLTYTEGGQQVWELGPGEPQLVDLPIHVGSFYGFCAATNQILYASVFGDHGAGPDNIAVSDLAIYDLTSGATRTLLADNVVEALWAPNGSALAYILATPETYELHWRAESGGDRVLAQDVTFDWSIAPSGDAVAFTRDSTFALTQDPGLFVVRVADGIEVKVSDADPQGFGSIYDQPIWSPDSDWVIMPLWATTDPRISLARADGSGARDVLIDPALRAEWWATAAIPLFLWDPGESRIVAAPAISQEEMGGPSPLVLYDLDPERAMLYNGRLLAEDIVLIGWDVPGQSVWVVPVDGVPERVQLP